MIKDQNVKKNLVKTELEKSLINEKAKFDEAYERFNKLSLLPKKKKNKPYFEFFLIEYDPSIYNFCLLYTSPSPRDQRGSRMPSSA